MQRTTGSTDELQKSHVLQLTRCYSFLQVLVISLWPFWERMLLQLSTHTASFSLRIRILLILDSLEKNRPVSKSQAGKHFPVNGFPIFFLEFLLISIWFYDFSSQNLFFQFKAAISYFPAIQYSYTRDRGN